MEEACERFLEAMDELVALLYDEPQWLETYFSMPVSWREISHGGAKWWNLFSRLDVFVTRDGSIQICEINSDTPSGQSDMWALLDAFGTTTPWGELPGGDYTDRFFDFLHRLAPTREGAQASKPTLAILYPTDVTEDLELIEDYRVFATARGFEVVLGGPRNLQFSDDGRVWLFGTPIDVILRHYKTDWWGERRRMWYNTPFIWDYEPLDELAPLLSADEAGQVAVVNPFASMPTQSKKALAFLWEHKSRFTPRSQETIERFVPFTRCIDAQFLEEALHEKDRWVLKSDFGCEGEEVLVGALVTQEAWRLSLKLIIPERWVAQEFFEVEPLADGWLPNFGLYTIAGKSAGLYTRINPPTGITDTHAVVLPVAIEASSER